MTECEIRKITAPLLIKQLFAIHAPALELEGEWPRLFEMNDAERAHELAERIKDLAKVSLKQRDLIYSHLGTIDEVSSQARQTLRDCYQLHPPEPRSTRRIGSVRTP